MKDSECYSAHNGHKEPQIPYMPSPWVQGPMQETHTRRPWCTSIDASGNLQTINLTYPDIMTSLPYGVTETYQSSTASKTLGFGWRGVYSTYAIYGQTEPLKALTPLKAEFNLPNNMLFRFLQLRHATQAQFSQPPLQSSPNPLIAITKDTDPKKLISCFYTMLTTPVATKITQSQTSLGKRSG